MSLANLSHIGEMLLGGLQMGKTNKLTRQKHAEIEAFKAEGLARLNDLTEREFLVAGVALYVAEGSKTHDEVALANTDPRVISFFCSWLRRFFEIDEARLRLRLYLHENLDLSEANLFWSGLTGIPTCQFGKPYRAIADKTIRSSTHKYGCPSIRYYSSNTHRKIMGLANALLSWPAKRGRAP